MKKLNLIYQKHCVLAAFLMLLFIAGNFQTQAQVVVENTSFTTGDNVSSLRLSYSISPSYRRLVLVGFALRRNGTSIPFKIEKI